MDKSPGGQTIAIVNGSPRFSGITLSAESFVEVLREVGFGVRWYQCVDRGKSPYLPSGSVEVAGAGVPFESLEMGLNRLWVFPRQLRHLEEKIVLLTDPTLSNVGRFHPRTIGLVWDLLPLTPYADRIDSRWMFRSVLPRLREMIRIVVPTLTMREELSAHKIDPQRIRVVRPTHALGLHPDHLERSAERLERSRVLQVLYVATDRPWKNIDFVLRLAKSMESTPTAARFRFTIVSQLKPSTWQRIRDLQVSNLRVIERVPSLSSLYEESDVLVYPSRHEGFGRPIIEGLGFGLPVLANRIQPFFELLGNAGTFLGVDSTEPWAEALYALADPSALRLQARKSLELAPLYAPDRFRTSVIDAFGDFLTGS